MRTGRLDDAIAKYKEVLAAHPDFYESWASLAYVHALRENYPEALRCLDELVERAPAGAAGVDNGVTRGTTSAISSASGTGPARSSWT